MRDHQGEGTIFGENVTAHCKIMVHSTWAVQKWLNRSTCCFGPWMKTRLGPWNHMLDGGADPPKRRDNFRRLSRPFKSIGNLRCSRRCRVRCNKDSSIANNVMQQKGSFSMTDKRKKESGKFRAQAMRPIGREGVIGVHSEGEVWYLRLLCYIVAFWPNEHPATWTLRFKSNCNSN